MVFGGTAFSGLPYAGADGDYVDFIDLELIFPVELLFFGEIGDVIPLPPDLDIVPANSYERRSPCLLYDN